MPFLWVLLALLSDAGALASAAPPDAAAQEALLRLTNEARAEAGLGALTADDALAEAARRHAAEMTELGYFSHTSPVAGHATLAQRVAEAGSFVRTLGENLALVGGADAAQASVSGWLDSPGHRANLLHPRFTHVGFGTARYPDGRVAVAQVLGYQPATLRRAALVPVLAETPLLRTTVSLAAPAEVALFYGGRSSPPQNLAAGTQVLSVPLSEPPSLPLPVQLGLRGDGDAFILQDDGWLRASGWERSGEVSGAQGQLLEVALSGSLEHVFELRLDFDSAPPALSAWQDGTLLPLRADGAAVTVTLAPAQIGRPVYVGEAQADGRYDAVYSFLPSTAGAPSVSPTSR